MSRPGIGQRWACQDPALTFPTVACLARDILTCGMVKQKSCVFYSFGAEGSDARSFATNELGGRGVTFKDALGDDYVKDVVNDARFGDIGEKKLFTKLLVNSANLNRANIFVRKLSQAFASVCSDEAYLTILQYKGKGGGIGIYQNPWVRPDKSARGIKDNVWMKDGFPSLTQNNKINRIWSVDISDNNKKSSDWVKGAGQRLPRNIDAVQLPPKEWPAGTGPQPQPQPRPVRQPPAK